MTMNRESYVLAKTAPTRTVTRVLSSWGFGHLKVSSCSRQAPWSSCPLASRPPVSQAVTLPWTALFYASAGHISSCQFHVLDIS